jgi:hypothetical protein
MTPIEESLNMLPVLDRLRDVDNSTTGKWISNTAAARIIDSTQFAYPVVLLGLFLLLFTAHGIITSSSGNTQVSSRTRITGPGGKPLPNNVRATKDKKDSTAFTLVQRLLFNWLSGAVILTFLGNSVNVLAHALAERQTGWWCGQAMVVSSPETTPPHRILN